MTDKRNDKMPDDVWCWKVLPTEHHVWGTSLPHENERYRIKDETKYRRDDLSPPVPDDVTVSDMAEWVRLLLPLAKGYVHANAGIRSTENIIEDAERCLASLDAVLDEVEYWKDKCYTAKDCIEEEHLKVIADLMDGYEKLSKEIAELKELNAQAMTTIGQLTDADRYTTLTKDNSENKIVY